MNTGNKPSTDVSFQEFLRRVLTGEYECRRAPEKDVEPGEVVLGKLENPVAKSMYSLWTEMSEGAKKYYDGLPENPPEGQKEEVQRVRRQVHQLQSRIACAKAVFFELVYSDFPKTRDLGVTILVSGQTGRWLSSSNHPRFKSSWEAREAVAHSVEFGGVSQTGAVMVPVFLYRLVLNQFNHLRCMITFNKCRHWRLIAVISKLFI